MDITKIYNYGKLSMMNVDIVKEDLLKLTPNDDFTKIEGWMYRFFINQDYIMTSIFNGSDYEIGETYAKYLVCQFNKLGKTISYDTDPYQKNEKNFHVWTSCLVIKFIKMTTNIDLAKFLINIFNAQLFITTKMSLTLDYEKNLPVFYGTDFTLSSSLRIYIDDFDTSSYEGGYSLAAVSLSKRLSQLEQIFGKDDEYYKVVISQVKEYSQFLFNKLLIEELAFYIPLMKNYKELVYIPNTLKYINFDDVTDDIKKLVILSKFDNKTIAFIFGYNLEALTGHAEFIANEFRTITESSLEDYLEELKRLNGVIHDATYRGKKFSESIERDENDDEISLSMKPIFSYSNDFRITIFRDNILFVFTAEFFQKICDSGVNQYTNEKLTEEETKKVKNKINKINAEEGLIKMCTNKKVNLFNNTSGILDKLFMIYKGSGEANDSYSGFNLGSGVIPLGTFPVNGNISESLTQMFSGLLQGFGSNY